MKVESSSVQDFGVLGEVCRTSPHPQHPTVPPKKKKTRAKNNACGTTTGFCTLECWHLSLHHNRYVHHSIKKNVNDSHPEWSQRRQVPRYALNWSLGTWPCHLTTRHWRRTLCGCRVTLQLDRNVVDAAGAFTTEFWLEQHFRETETFGATSMMFRLGERRSFSCQISTGRFELCVVIQTNVARFFFFFKTSGA